MKKKLFLNLDENTMNQSISCEFGPDGVRFVRSGIKVTKDGMSKVTGSQIMPLSIVRAEDIEFKGYIGKGNCGYVQEGIYKPTNFPIAIKTINAFDKAKRHQVMNDLKVYLSDIYSKGKTSLDEEMLRYLVHLYGAYYDEGSLRIILELMDVGSLRDILNMVIKLKSGPPYIEEPYLANIAYQILMGLNYLHGKKHQIHRDIKPENVLMNSLGQVKLTDFGISKELEKTLDVCKTFVGTMTFMSPERVEGKVYTYSSDIWSFGLMLIELASGEFPFGKDKGYIQMIQAILEAKEPELPDNGLYSAELRDFIKLCLNRDPSKRATAYELLQHKWLYINSELNKDLAEWINGIRFIYKNEKMGEEKNPLADKLLKNGKTLSQEQKETKTQFDGKFEVEKAGQNILMDSKPSNGFQQEFNYQPVSQVGSTMGQNYQPVGQIGGTMGIMSNGMMDEKFEAPKPKYTQQNVQCDMEIESLE